jgi:GT2 family glycosyltransferase
MTMRPDPPISVIIVSYNVREELDRCLGAIAPVYRRGVAEVYVVDNASADDSATVVPVRHPWVQWIQNPTNAGFAAGVNRGLARVKGVYVLLLNPDAVVQNDAVERLAAFMTAHPDCGIAGAQLVNPDGSLQESFHAFPTPGAFIAESLFWKKAAHRLRRPEAPVEVDAVVGACFMVRRRVVEEIGLLDEHFFLYSEEVDWCLRARRSGWKVFLVPDATVAHGLARSSEDRPEAAFVALYRGRAYYMQKHFTRRARWLAHAGMGAGVLLRVMLWGAACAGLRLAGRRPAQARKKFRQNSAVLGWYMRGCPGPRRD